ncbi:MAG: hypothetical protein IPI88_12510 [Chitinophagaceae bacterium]|nr:hypothetical protein [Chitinophagaceae bacterium]
MTAIKKYRYMDWWNGNIYFIYAKIVYNEENKKEIPPRVSWDDIKQTDVPKIREKQRGIFKAEVSKKIKFWKEDFAKRYKNSKATTLLLNRELLKFEHIVYSPMPYTNDSHILYRGIILTIESLSTIKNYIDNTKVNGATIEFDFIHSPNFLFQDKTEIPPQVYAECCWLYVRWLKLNFKQKKQKRKALPSAVVNNAPSNPFPNIFTNGYAYDMFLELQKLTVSKKTMVADYAFIFHQMKSNTLKAIHPNLSHRSFIKFLSDNKYADLDVTKLPFKNPRKKQPTFSSLLEKYKDSILGNQPQ